MSQGIGKDFCLSEILGRKKPADKAQQRIRKLVATLERKREELRQWQAYEQRYNQRVRTEFEPVSSEELFQQQRRMAVLIDELLTRLEAELDSVIEPYRELMGRWSERALTVAEVDRKLTMDLTQLHEAVRQLTLDLWRFAIRRVCEHGLRSMTWTMSWASWRHGGR